MESFVPLRLDLVDEGRFIDKADAILAFIQAELHKHMKTYGPSASKAKATLKMKITLRIEDPKSGVVSIKSGFVKELPSEPDSVTQGISVEDEGQGRLFVHPAGSSYDSPAQGRFFNEDGRRIDVGTAAVEEGDWMWLRIPMPQDLGRIMIQYRRDNAGWSARHEVRAGTLVIRCSDAVYYDTRDQALRGEQSRIIAAIEAHNAAEVIPGLDKLRTILDKTVGENCETAVSA